MNLCMHTGRIGTDLKLEHITARKTKEKIAVLKFRLAVKPERKEDETIWLSFEAWNSQAENIAKFFSKGKLITLISKSRDESWEARDANGKPIKKGDKPLMMSTVKFKVDRWEFPEYNPYDGPDSESEEGDEEEAPAKASKNAKGSGKSGKVKEEKEEKVKPATKSRKKVKPEPEPEPEDEEEEEEEDDEVADDVDDDGAGEDEDDEESDDEDEDGDILF